MTMKRNPNCTLCPLHATAEYAHGNTIHGHSGTHRQRSREYRAWVDMKARCKYPYHSSWKNYGGRGIKVCKKWLNDFEAFYRDVGPAPSELHELDRKKVNQGYKPGNVRWVTHRENSWNMRKTTWVTYRGKRKPLQQWCIELNLNRRTVARRLQHGKSPREAFR